MRRLFVSPPAGQRLRFLQPCLSPEAQAQTTFVLGTFTAERRPGLLRGLSTLRWDAARGGWVNAVGLRNAGLEAGLRMAGKRHALSIGSARGKAGWADALSLLQKHDPASLPHRLELNLSCPNVAPTSLPLEEVEGILRHCSRSVVTAKVSPGLTKTTLRLLGDCGLRSFHACNTLPLESGGGLSGPALRPYVLEQIAALRALFGKEVEIVAGGGVRSRADEAAYISAGADAVSVSSLAFNPLRLWAFLEAPVSPRMYKGC